MSVSISCKDEFIVATIEGSEAALTMEEAGKLEVQLHKARRDALEAAIKVRKTRWAIKMRQTEERGPQREAQREPEIDGSNEAMDRVREQLLRKPS
jgi:hypothetical protein